MTIHSEWTKIFYQECPEAFIESCDSNECQDVKVGIIDGHLQLMCLNERMVSWDRFIQYMFINPIENMYKMGCSTIVLCFDAYDYVPAYKNMTQIKRTSGKTVCTFHASQELPSKIPQDAIKYLMNRIFKVKLIQMLCDRIPSMLTIRSNQEFIIDYKRVVMYRPNIVEDITISNLKYPLQSIPMQITDMEPMGESDVKFTRYVQKYGNALVHAIDGDYMIIALLYYSNVGLTSDNNIYLYRQKQRCFDEDECRDHDRAALSEKKRKQSPFFQNSVSRCIDGSHVPPYFKNKKTTTSTNIAESKKINKKNKCWVNMQLIYNTLLHAYRQSMRTDYITIDNPFGNEDNMISRRRSERDFMRSIVFLILCAGTDFSRQLPLMGPQRLWENLPHISLYMLDAVNKNDVLGLTNIVVSKLYKSIFSRHVQHNGLSWDNVLTNLLASTLSKSTKDKFPRKHQVITTIKNIMWVIQYWDRVNGNVPTPLDGSNGYIVCRTTNKIVFEDMEQGCA